MLDPLDVKVLDLNSEYFGVSAEQLMENAGKNVAQIIQERFDIKGKHICVIAGSGNNGGDGFVAARYLAAVAKVTVYLVNATIKSSIAKKNFDRLKDVYIDTTGQCIDYADFIIDALLGTGVKGQITGKYAEIITMLNNCHKPIISIDIPSGFGTNLAVVPTLTVTNHDIKAGMNVNNSGEIVVSDIGIPTEAVEYVGPGDFLYFPVPENHSHKGENGIVLVIGGGMYTGAPAFTAMAAYRTGADLVYIITSSKVFNAIASYSPSFIVLDLFEQYLTSAILPKLEPWLKKASAIVIGPGLGYNEEIESAVLKIIEMTDTPIVIDADALKAVSTRPEVLFHKKAVITPHLGEFRIISGNDPIEDNVIKLAQKLHITVLLKGKIDMISDGTRLKKNKTGNVAMTVGGTGDVLAGIVAALLAKKLDPFKAASLAAFISGAAGDLAFKQKFYGLLPEDVIDNIPEVCKRYIPRK